MTQNPTARNLTAQNPAACSPATSSLHCPDCGRWLAGRARIPEGDLTLHCRRCGKNWEWTFTAGYTSVREVERPSAAAREVERPPPTNALPRHGSG